MPLARFEPAITARDLSQIFALDREVTGLGTFKILVYLNYL